MVIDMGEWVNQAYVTLRKHNCTIPDDVLDELRARMLCDPQVMRETVLEECALIAETARIQTYATTFHAAQVKCARETIAEEIRSRKLNLEDK